MVTHDLPKVKLGVRFPLLAFYITMSQTFIKRTENFTCANCEVPVVGDGYTNHCPRCLYSQHVDVHPGDRLAECRGLMAPIALERRHGVDQILHRCLKCHYTRANRTAPTDDLAALTDILL